MAKPRRCADLEQMIERLKHEIAVIKKGGHVVEMTDEQEHELMAAQERSRELELELDEGKHLVSTAGVRWLPHRHTHREWRVGVGPTPIGCNKGGSGM